MHFNCSHIHIPYIRSLLFIILHTLITVLCFVFFIFYRFVIEIDKRFSNVNADILMVLDILNEKSDNFFKFYNSLSCFIS